MAKASGLGDRLFIGGYDLSGDIGSIGRVGGGPAALDCTDITQSGNDRFGGTKDGAIDYSAYWNSAAGRAHPVLSALPRTDVVETYLRGTTLGGPGAGMIAKQVGYDPTRGQDGSLTMAINSLSTAAYPLEWGDQLTAGLVTITGAGNGTGIDLTATTAFGASAYLQVTAFTGTDATIAVQMSSDDGVGDAYAAPAGGLSFTQVTSAPFSQRITTASSTASIERYVRYAVTTAAGFTSLSFLVVVMKRQSTVDY